MFKNTDHGGVDLFFILFPENKKWNYIFTLNFEINYFYDTINSGHASMRFKTGKRIPT